jgi:hypothetical protein
MTPRILALAAALTIGTAAFAQTPAPTGVQPGQPGSPEAGETSDRTPDKATTTPQSQQDTAGGKTSDRSQGKDVKVEHAPGAAGTGGSEMDSSASGSKTTTPSATPPAGAGSSK